MEIKTNVSHNFPPAPPSVTVTVQIEDDEVDTQGECRRIRNQKRAIWRHRTAKRRQDWGGDSYDYYNSNLRNVINIGHDAYNIIISKRREREEIEAYSPISNYRIPKDYLEQPQKRLHTSSSHQLISHGQQTEKASAAQQHFNRALHGHCLCHPKGKHSTFECHALRKALGAPLLGNAPRHLENYNNHSEKIHYKYYPILCFTSSCKITIV